jgi:hypothetical protein
MMREMSTHEGEGTGVDLAGPLVRLTVGSEDVRDSPEPEPV